jgi:hypothetical protein
MRDDRVDYYERQQDRADAAGRIIVMLWLFFSGAAAGWILHRVVGG